MVGGIIENIVMMNIGVMVIMCLHMLLRINRVIMLSSIIAFL
jgi:hypothetical protein